MSFMAYLDMMIVEEIAVLIERTIKRQKAKYRQTSSLKADLSLMSDWHHLKETVLGKGYIISWWQRSSFNPQNNGLGFVLTWEYYCKENDRYAEKKFSHK